MRNELECSLWSCLHRILQRALQLSKIVPIIPINTTTKQSLHLKKFTAESGVYLNFIPSFNNTEKFTLKST